MAKKIYATLIALVCLVSAISAYAACGGGRYQRAVRVGGDYSGYPAECRVPCKNENSIASLWGSGGSFPFAPVLHWQYQIRQGAAPSNNCPSDVYNASFQ